MSSSQRIPLKSSDLSQLERIANGRTDLVFDLVAAGNPATMSDHTGVSIIQWCAYYGDVSAIRYLLDHGEKLQSLGENFGLIGAAFHGHWQLCAFLLEHGADANDRDPKTGETPLHATLCATTRPGCFLCARVLLDYGADPNRPTLPGVETGSFMRDSRTKGETPLHRAAAFGSEEVIRWLIEAGASLQAQDMSGDTPLSWASWHLRPAPILHLLCYDSYVVRADRKGMDTYLLGEPVQQLDQKTG